MDEEVKKNFLYEVSTKKGPYTDLEKYFIKNKNKIYGVIYMITNCITDKSYVGRRKLLTTSVGQLHSYYGSGSYIRRAVKAYGIENFKKVYIDVAYSDEELDEKEIYYIKKYQTIENGYNLTPGGDHFKGHITDNELRKRKISEWSRNWWSNPENKEKFKQLKLGTKHSEETKKKMSESAKKSWTEERHRQAKESGNYKNKPLTKEQKLAISRRNKGRIKIYKDNIEMQVKPDDLEYYLNNGWRKGMAKESIEKLKKSLIGKNLGRKTLIKDGEVKMFRRAEVEEALANGWDFISKRSKKAYENKKY